MLCKDVWGLLLDGAVFLCLNCALKQVLQFECAVLYLNRALKRVLQFECAVFYLNRALKWVLQFECAVLCLNRALKWVLQFECAAKNSKKYRPAIAGLLCLKFIARLSEFYKFFQ